MVFVPNELTKKMRYKVRLIFEININDCFRY